MKIGYLHIGPSWHGIVRYGRLLASEAQQRSDLTIIEADVVLTEDPQCNRKLLIEAARQLSTAEVIHIQVSYVNSKSLWGAGWQQLKHLRLFIHCCTCPIVVTLHDLHLPPPSFKAAFSKLKRHQVKSTALSTVSSPAVQVTSAHKITAHKTPDASGRSPSQRSAPIRSIRFLRSLLRPNVLSLYWLLNKVQLIFVCSEEEVKRLSYLSDDSQISCVPHFVESRVPTIDPIEAKATLNLNEGKIVTLLGFIHPIKGHQLMIEALPQLPKNVKVVFAGGAKSPGQKQFVEDLFILAKAKGVDQQLRITGYLSEEELEQYLIATDLAVCPFQSMCASGSLSTWVSISRPILAYDLPQIAEYNRLEPGVIQIFQSYNATALAQAIEQFFAAGPQDQTQSGARLRQRLSLSTIFDQHLTNYRDVLSPIQITAQV